MKTLWEGTAVIAVFLCVGGYRLSAAHTYRGVYQREFSVAFLMDKTSVRKKCRKAGSASEKDREEAA